MNDTKYNTQVGATDAIGGALIARNITSTPRLPDHQIRPDTTPIPPQKSHTSLIVTIVLVLLIVVGIAVAWLYIQLSQPLDSAESAAQSVNSRYDATTLSVGDLGGLSGLQSGTISDLLINGTLSISGGLALTPATLPTPTAASTGRFYYDATTNQPYFYDGSRYISLAADSAKSVQSLGGRSGSIVLGSGLTMQGGTLSSTALQSLPQNLTISSTPAFASLSLTQPLAVTSGGSGRSSLTQNGLLIGNGTNPLTSLAPAGANQCLVSANTPDGLTLTFSYCPGATGVASVNGLNGALTIGNATSSGSTITLDDASTTSKGIASFNSTNFTITSGAVNTIQDLATTSSPTFNGLSLFNALGLGHGGTGATTAGGARANLGAAQSGANGDITATTVLNTITPTNTLTLGASGFGFVLQGNGSSTITASSGGSTTTLSFANPIANTILTLPALTAGTYSLCTTSGNCAGVGGSVTTIGGTTNKLAKFSGTNTLVDSIIGESGSVATVAGSGIIQGASGTASLTVGTTSTNTGKLILANSTNANTLTLQSGATTSNLTFTLPVVDGSNGQCLTTSGTGVLAFTSCLSGAGVDGGVASLNGLVGGLTLANSTGVGSIITINDATTAAKGIASFNSTNFTVTSGAVNTVQNIATTSSPTFASATLTSASGLMVGSSTVAGNITIRDGNAQSYGITLNTTALTSDKTVSFRDAAGTVCLEGNSGCGFAPSTGSGSYVWLGPATIQGDATSNPSIYINKTANAHLMYLRYGGSDRMLVSGSGNYLSLPADGSQIQFANNGSNGTIRSSGGLLTITNNAGSAGTDNIVIQGGQPGGNLALRASNIKFVNNGNTVEYGRFDSNGTLNINTAASTAYKLNVQGAVNFGTANSVNGDLQVANNITVVQGASGASTIAVTNGNATGMSRIYLNNTATNGRSWALGVGGDTANGGGGSGTNEGNFTLNNVTDGLTPLVIRKSTGYVGIGAASNPQAALEVGGSAYFGNIASTGNGGSVVKVYTGNTANANSGIDIIRGPSWSSPSSVFGMHVLSDGSGIYRGAFGFADSTAFAEQLTINSNGSVGIGTGASINAKLHTVTTASAVGMIIQGAASQAADLFVARDSSLSNLVRIDSAGGLIANKGILALAGVNTNTPMTLRGAVSQSSDLMQVQDSSANVIARFGSSGNLVLNNGTGAYISTTGDILGSNQVRAGASNFGSSYVLQSSARTAADVAAAFRGASSQTADLLQLQNSSGTVIAKFDASANFSTNGTMTISGTGTSSIAGALGIGTTNPMTTSVTLANTWWFSGVDAAGTGTINMFQPSSNNDIQVGAALNIDGGIIFPTDGGQLTMSDMGFSSSGVAAGTPNSYTMRIGMTNALTVYAENDGAGNAQNVRIAIGTSIAPQYTLDVGGTIATTSDIRLGGHIITTGATPGIAAGAAACTSPTVSVAGSDTAGTITITTGTGCAAGGTLATITFAAGYGAAPRVIFTPANAISAALPVYRTSSTASFTIATPNTPTSSTTFVYDYVVHQ